MEGQPRWKNEHRGAKHTARNCPIVSSGGEDLDITQRLARGSACEPGDTPGGAIRQARMERGSLKLRVHLILRYRRRCGRAVTAVERRRESGGCSRHQRDERENGEERGAHGGRHV